jgi:hypothetical protein
VSVRTLARHGTLDIVERRAREDSHPNIRSVAKDFIKTEGVVAAVTAGHAAAADAQDYQPRIRRE